MGMIALLICLGLAPQDQNLDELIERLGADFLEDREPARLELLKAGAAAETKLVQALSHPDSRVRVTCLGLLVPLKSKAALPRATELFAKDEDVKVHEAAFHLLQAIGKEAQEALAGALLDPYPKIRRMAIETLAKEKSLPAMSKISDLAGRDPDPGVKDEAMKYLFALGPAAQAPLLSHLENADAQIRRRVIEFLDTAPSDEAVAAVSRLLGQESDGVVILQAARFLEHVGLRGEPAFLTALDSPAQATRLASIRGLTAIKSPKGLGPVSDLFLGKCPPEVRETSALYLKSQGLRAEEPLLRGMESPDAEIRQGSIRMLGEIGSLKALEPIRALYREEKSGPLHEACFTYFSHLGLRAESDLVLAMGDEDKGLRCRAALALGAAGSERAIPRLIEIMTELDPVMKEAAEAALATIGPKAVEEVRAAVAAGRLREGEIQTLERLMARYEVERLLDTQFGDDLVTGFFDNQFSNIAAFGRDKAVPVLVQIAGEPGYVFHREHPERQALYRSRMRDLAVMALGELGGDEALAAVRAIRNTPEFRRIPGRFQEETLVSLHRMGDKAPLDEHIQRIRQVSDQLMENENPQMKAQGCYNLFNLSMLYGRLKRTDEAAQACQDVLDAHKRYKLEKMRFLEISLVKYNLACFAAVKGDTQKSIEWLEMAVREGYTNREWIKKDRDLDSIRNEEGYKKLIANDRLFERRIGPN